MLSISSRHATDWWERKRVVKGEERRCGGKTVSLNQQENDIITTTTT